MKYDIKCDCCGKFISIDDLNHNRCDTLFIPDSEVSYEELRYRCETCLDKYGKLSSIQFGIVRY